MRRTFETQKLGRVLTGFIICTVMLVQCASTPSPGDGAGSTYADRDESDIPGWYREPHIEGYYVGVGHASSADSGENLETATTRAEADLAAAIAIEVERDFEARVGIDVEEGYYEEMHQAVSTYVRQRIQGRERARIYQDPSSSAVWVKVRLSKSHWEEIEAEQRRELQNEMERIDDRQYGHGSLFDQLATLEDMWNTLSDSPHGRTIQARLFGREGLAIHRITEEYQDLLEAVTIQLPESQSDTLLPGEAYTLEGRVRSSGEPGAIPLKIYRRLGNERELLHSITTNRDGRFDVEIIANTQGMTEDRLDVTLDDARLPTLRDVRLPSLPSAEYRAAVEELPPFISNPEFVFRGGVRYYPTTLVGGDDLLDGLGDVTTTSIGKPALSADLELALTLGKYRLPVPVYALFAIVGNWYEPMGLDNDIFVNRGVPPPTERYVVQSGIGTRVISTAEQADFVPSDVSSIGEPLSVDAALGASFVWKSYDEESIDGQEFGRVSTFAPVGRVRLTVGWFELMGEVHYFGNGTFEPSVFLGLRDRQLLYVAGTMIAVFAPF